LALTAPLSSHRIAFCITDLDIGGAERCLVEVARGLNRHEWQPHVFCLGPPGELSEVLKAADVPATSFNMRGLHHAHRIVSLASHLRRFRPHILQTFLFHGNMAGRLAGSLARVPIVVSGIRVAEREKSWHVWLQRWTRGLVTHHVCVSQSVAEFAIHSEKLAPDSVTVIPNGVDVGRFAHAQPIDLTAHGIPPGSRLVLAIGRLHAQKGHDLLIDAIAPLMFDQADVHLAIVGDGPERASLQQRIESQRLSSRIHLVGRQADVAPWLKSSALFVLPSRWEGMPNVVLEAMAAGVAVICTDVEGIREMLPGDLPAAVVPPANPAALRRAIMQHLDPHHAQTAREAVSEYISAKWFTTSYMVERYARLYHALLQERLHVNV
jgi:glycosyltransferase involved in cell wall biosynthesis